MWFYDENWVSAHALAYAAYEIAHVVSKAKDPKRHGLLLDSGYIKSGTHAEFNRKLKERGPRSLWVY
ncbi:hypothetical protein [Bradyrhizobium acaciae]|uniref:hypothetical protein n=1 Tax=Bradyrhizobium acaciae TaxID=2683706 RepID=UPI001E3600EC|nr:hypothetical protein [Bradyrhizobium acaciae]MCC8983846.1 hypothetical protein [Bradyrhizobium acaciae]